MFNSAHCSMRKFKSQKNDLEQFKVNRFGSANYACGIALIILSRDKLIVKSTRRANFKDEKFK